MRRGIEQEWWAENKSPEDQNGWRNAGQIYFEKGDGLTGTFEDACGVIVGFNRKLYRWRIRPKSFASLDE